MKFKRVYPVALPLLFGIAAAALREQLYRLALEDNGLLRAGHPLEYVLWALILCGAAAILVCARKQEDLEGTAPGTNLTSAVGAWLMAAGIALPGDAVVSSLPVLNTVYLVVRWGAALSMLVAGISRLSGKRPFFGFHGVTCVFFAVHMVMRYQEWSRHPQLQDYVFALLGCICLALLAYYQTAADADTDKPRLRLTFGMLACFLCCAAIPCGEYRLLYLTGAVWAITTVAAAGRKPEQTDGTDA